MASSMRAQYHRLRRWLGWLNDDREMERAADVDLDSTRLRDAVRPAAVASDPQDDTRPADRADDEASSTD